MHLLYLTSLFFLLLFSASTYGQSTSQDRKEKMEQWLAKTLKEPVAERMDVQSVIKDEQMAVVIAEAYAFGIYGEDEIKQQRPYHVELISGHWRVSGSRPKDRRVLGGVFNIVLDAKDGRVVLLRHTK